MRVRSSELALLGWRALDRASTSLDKSQRRLSSGLRVSRAADDAANLSMSQSISGQISGLKRASQNAVDGISLLQVAESALSEIHGLLQRANELAVQAVNSTLTRQDRETIQEEVNDVLAEIDRITEMTTFNDKPIFGTSGQSTMLARVVTGLRTGWLKRSAEVILNNYGIQGDGVPLKVVLENSGAEAAWISGTPEVGNRLAGLTLHINVAEIDLADGGPIYNDRKIARALTQAVLARHSEYYNVPDWFRSGVADYISGRNEQLEQDISTYTLAGVVGALSTPWVEDSIHQSAGYLAVRYMESRLGFFTMKDFMSMMSGGLDFNTALSLTVGVSDATFVSDFLAPGPGGGEDFASTLIINDPNDVGGIGGGDASTVIPNGDGYTENPLSPQFRLELDAGVDPTQYSFQVGPNERQTIEFEIPSLSTFSLGLLGIDIVNNPGAAITKFQTAIQTVSSVRASLGSVTNRLEHVVNSNNVMAENQTAAYSRLVDADMASELTTHTRNQLLLSASAAIMAQANSIRQNVLWLLRDMFSGAKR